MRHDHDDATIGAYLAGELPTAERDAFEEHLLTCDRCWAEVDAGRRGRALVAQAREQAPAQLRERVRATVAAAQPTRRSPRTLVLAAAALALIAALAATAVISSRSPGEQPAQITAAVAGYRDARLPGSGIPSRPGPDLSPLRLAETGAGTGDLAGQPVTAHAYRDDTGRRLLIYLSDEPFPMPAQADHPNGTAGAGITNHHGVTVLCSRAPHTALIIGDDPNLVQQAATTLNFA